MHLFTFDNKFYLTNHFYNSLQCFNAVGWLAGRASGL